MVFTEALPSLMSPMLVGSPSYTTSDMLGGHEAEGWGRVTPPAPAPGPPSFMARRGSAGGGGSAENGSKIPTPGAAGNTPVWGAMLPHLAVPIEARAASGSSMAQVEWVTDR